MIILGWKLSKTVYDVLCHARIKYLCCTLVGCQVSGLGGRRPIRWFGLGGICKLVGGVGLGEEKVTHIHLWM